MKRILKTTILLTVAALFFTGCETENKSSKGVSSEDKNALVILKRIVDRKFDGDFEIEKNNIVIWDHNSAGRYTCKAKIKKMGEKKSDKKEALPKDDMLSFMKMLAPAQYGIGADGGWVNYYTYETTTSTKENRRMYVEIFVYENGN